MYFEIFTLVGHSETLPGGFETPKTVSIYDKDGWVRDMPNLNEGRQEHGCATFLVDEEQVRQNI